VSAAKNSSSKNHPKDILHDKNHLYRIVIVHLHRMMHLTQENIFRWLDVEFFLIVKTRNFVSLPCCLTMIRKPRCQTKHHTAAIICHNNKLTSEMCLLGSDECGASVPRSFYLPLGSSSYSCSKTIINTFLKQCI